MVGVRQGFDSGLLPLDAQANFVRRQLANQSRLFLDISVENLSLYLSLRIC